ncbi:lycopene cyclase domain-containing protein [Microbacterium sp. ZW T6_19]|uniref:lycopene cyclase domain-containing protein n=1 Tax=Microbacterium sp. ZW T6_19 TaxID=3378082 RepID=UPI0038546338
MSAIYLLCLLAASAFVVAVDLRFRLFLGRSWRQALLVLAAGLAFFLVWDLAGIGLGIFARGDAPYLTGVMIAPELPIEEPVFLLFLCEITMVLVLGADRLLRRAASRRPGPRRRG